MTCSKSSRRNNNTYQIYAIRDRLNEREISITNGSYVVIGSDRHTVGGTLKFNQFFLKEHILNDASYRSYDFRGEVMIGSTFGNRKLSLD